MTNNIFHCPKIFYRSGEAPSVLQLPHEHNTAEVEALVRCSQHMCPIRVHWHVKQSYTQYWRVKITITNLNFAKNYSDWNLVVMHPNLRNITQVFSFNYSPLNQYGNISKFHHCPLDLISHISLFLSEFIACLKVIFNSLKWQLNLWKMRT